MKLTGWLWVVSVGMEKEYGGVKLTGWSWVVCLGVVKEYGVK